VAVQAARTDEPVTPSASDGRQASRHRDAPSDGQQRQWCYCVRAGAALRDHGAFRCRPQTRSSTSSRLRAGASLRHRPRLRWWPRSRSGLDAAMVHSIATAPRAAPCAEALKARRLQRRRRLKLGP
jgi:hypothetical protein